DAGIEVVAIVDTPAPGFDVPECVAENRDDLTACAVPLAEAVARSGASLHHAAAALAPAVDLVDVTAYVCPWEECVPVVGGVLTQPITQHLKALDSRSLAPRLVDHLTPLVRRPRGWSAGRLDPARLDGEQHGHTVADRVGEGVVRVGRDELGRPVRGRAVDELGPRHRTPEDLPHPGVDRRRLLRRTAPLLAPSPAAPAASAGSRLAAPAQSA